MTLHPVLGRTQTVLVQEQKARAWIECTTSDALSTQAAGIFQRFIREMSGASLPIRSNPARAQPVRIRLDNRPANQALGIREDGFLIRVTDNEVLVKAMGDRGILYGVVEILDTYLDVKYFGAHEYVVPTRHRVQLPLIDTLLNPAFRYRQTQFYGIEEDSMYAIWHRLEKPAEIFVHNYWVHTFDRILPSDTYGSAHPEFYSFFKGRRNPGKASQWCLSNEFLFEEVCRNLDSLFASDPTRHLISVSQNDGNFTNCTCPSCSRIDDENGSPSGSLVYFLNKLATRYPDKEFSTLAYLYSMAPPAHIRPLPNVNIMLCSIDADREVPLTDNRSGRAFVNALEGWSAISNNLFIWDYGINFDNYLSPFPNFHVLQDNIRLFRKNHATMHFSQIGGARGGNFSALRAYLVAHLLWNPDADVDRLMREFLDGYYGPAGGYMYQYIKIMEGALLASGQRLWIYDSPVTHKGGMLRPALLRNYHRLFQEAEAAVRGDSVWLSRVQVAKLPLLYSGLEIARTLPEMATSTVEADLAEFERLVTRYAVPSLNERNNAPLDYCALYRARYLGKSAHLASGKKVSFLLPPHTRYRELATRALTDGLYGGTTFVESWVGWEGQDGAMVVDLEEVRSVRQVSVDFLHQLGAWILLPRQVTFSRSEDGVTYIPWATIEKEEDRDAAVKFVEYAAQSDQKVSARFIKIEVSGVNVCPGWHYGVGYPCWFFMDEIKVE